MSGLLSTYLGGHFLLSLYGYFKAKENKLDKYNWLGAIFIFGGIALGVLNIKIGKRKLGWAVIIAELIPMFIYILNH